MALATLSIDLVAKLANLERDLGAAVRVADKHAKRMAGAFDAVKVAFSGVAAGLSVGAFALAAKGVADYADNVGKMSQRVGVATEELSKLQYAASLSDVSNESLGSGLKRLAKIIAEANGGMVQQQRILKELGVKETKDVNIAFQQLAERFSTMEEGAGKTAAAMAVFGKAGADLLPLLNAGAKGLRDAGEEAERFGIVIGKDAVAAAEQFNDNLTRLETLIQGVRIALFSGLVDGLGRATTAFLEASKQGSAFEAALRGVQTFLTGDDQYKNDVKLVQQTERKLKLETEIQDLRKSGSALDLALARHKSEQLKVLDDEIKTTLNYRKVLAGEVPVPPKKTGKVDASIFNTGTGAGAGRTAKVAKDLNLANKELERYAEQLEATIQRTQDLSAVETARLFLSKQTGVSTEDAARILNLARQIDLEKELSAAQEKRIRLGREAAYEQGVDNSARAAQLAGLLDATASAQLEKTRADMVLLTEEFQRFIDTNGRAGISEKIYLEAVQARLGITSEALEKTNNLAEELGLTFTSAFEDAVVGGKKFSEVLRGLEQDILRIVTRKLVTEPLGNAITGLFGGGNFLSNLFGGSSSGGLFSALGFGPRANGGPVLAGGAYLVGERGPELFSPRSNGTIIPNGAGGRSINITVNQSFSPSTSRATVAQAAAEARRQLEVGGRNL